MNEKEYLGDGCYARDVGFGIVLTTENGISVQNEIEMEPAVLRAFFRFIERTYGWKISIEDKEE